MLPAFLIHATCLLPVDELRCVVCDVLISEHNFYLHDEMCDKCFWEVYSCEEI